MSAPFGRPDEYAQGFAKTQGFAKAGLNLMLAGSASPPPPPAQLPLNCFHQQLALRPPGL